MNQQSDQLRNAGIAAASHSADAPPERPVTPCPLAELRYVLDVKVVGEDDSPVADVAVELRKSPNEVLLDCTGPAGTVRFPKLRAGAYQISLYQLDSEAWELISTSALSAQEAKSSGDAEWVSSPPPEQPQVVTHTAVQGECIPKLADRFGFSPEFLWSFGGNSEVAGHRVDRNVLNPGDLIKVPPKRLKTVPASTGQIHTLRRKGIPEILKIRFLREGKPRPGVPYLIAFTTLTGPPLADRSGSTDGNGSLAQPVPPAVSAVQVTLGKGPEQQIHSFQVSHLDPIDTISGVKGRLFSLGYDCGGVNNELDWMTRSAVACFEIDQKLTPTADPTDATFRAALQKEYLS